MSAPVAIFSALDIELSMLVTAAGDVREQTTPLGVVQTGTLDSASVVFCRVGIGKVNAAAWVGVVASTFQPRTMIFTGVAGGVDPSLDVGDIVVGELLVQHDTGVLEHGGLTRYQPGHVPFFNPTSRFGFDPPPAVMARVRERMESFEATDVLGRNPHIVFGTILTGDQFVNDPSQRDSLHQNVGGHAVEMEGAALAQVAESMGIDYVVVRSISDLAGTASDIDFNRFANEAAQNSAAIVRHLLPVL